MTVIISMGLFPTYAQENKAPIEGEKNEAIVSFELAGQIIRYGYANESPMALLNGAEIILSINPTDLKIVKEEKTGTPDHGKKEGKIEFDVKKILADAKQMMNGDKSLLALADNIEKRIGSSRGATGGASSIAATVYANSFISWTVNFVGGVRACVAVVGDGDTDLDLYIYDQNGNLIAKDDGYSDSCIVEWYPKWTGSFLIKVVNRGSVYNTFGIATN